MSDTRSWIDPRATLFDSPLGGRGLFATAPIQKGEVVVIWKENYITAEEAGKAKAEGKLVMQWDENLFSVEERGDDVGYFINHSCDPNLWMQGINTLVARKDIQTGDEITADYALWEADENYIASWNCGCKSSLCRHKITGKDWRSVELQERYENHFSPLLNKRIQNSK